MFISRRTLLSINNIDTNIYLSQIKECSSKCSDKKEVLDKALKCLQKECGGLLSSIKPPSGPKATAGVGVDAGNTAGDVGNAAGNVAKMLGL